VRHRGAITFQLESTIYVNQNSILHYPQAGHKPNGLGGLLPLLPTVPLTPQNSVLPTFGIENIKLLLS
jgi:hypothetical protein